MLNESSDEIPVKDNSLLNLIPEEPTGRQRSPSEESEEDLLERNSTGPYVTGELSGL